MTGNPFSHCLKVAADLSPFFQVAQWKRFAKNSSDKPHPVPPPDADPGRYNFSTLLGALASVAKNPGFPVDVFILATLPNSSSDAAKSQPVGTPSETVDVQALPSVQSDRVHRLWIKPVQPGPIPRSLETQGTFGAEFTRVSAETALMAIPALEDDPIKSGDPLEDDTYIATHGLFVAGIIKRIAPRTRIYLIQVLNEHGIGTTMSMAAGFESVRRLRELSGQTGAPCIINCSFVVAAPVSADATTPENSPNGLPHDPADLDEGLKNRPDAQELFGKLVNLESDISLCALVAAAGNDSSGSPQPFMARYPARLPVALGVGALTVVSGGLKLVRAKYSNLPDSPVDDGLLTIGTVSGLFTGPIPPSTSGVAMTPTGFAEWSGTSFATPVITGLLALLVSEYGLTLPMAKIALRGLEHHLDPIASGESA